MDVWCPCCNEKIEVENDELEKHYNDWLEDQLCPQCGEKFDMFIELEPVAVSYAQRFFKCAECGRMTKHIKLRRNPYVEDNKKYCEECFNKNVVKWAEKLKADAEATKAAKKARRGKTAKPASAKEKDKEK